MTNPEAVKGHEGQEVTLKATVNASKDEIHVTSMKMAKSGMKGNTKEMVKETEKKDEKKY